MIKSIPENSYVVLDGEARKINKVYTYNSNTMIDVENYATHYVQEWHIFISKESYESSLFYALR